MQRTADFHDQIADACLPQTARVVDDAAALDAAVDVLDADPAARNPAIGPFLRTREGAAAWFLGGHDDLDVVEGERQEAEILEPPAARGQGVRRGIHNPLVMGAARVSIAQEEAREHGVDQQHVFHRVALFLAAIIARLLSRILGAPDAPFRPIVAKRGETGTGAGAGGSAGVDGSSVAATRAAASASVTPMRVARSFKERAGASPSVRIAACRTTNRT
jgi:hypothetical protein